LMTQRIKQRRLHTNNWSKNRNLLKTPSKKRRLLPIFLKRKPPLSRSKKIIMKGCNKKRLRWKSCLKMCK